MFTAYAKMSKRNKAMMDKQKRNVWAVKPVTRIKPSAKIYNRKKVHYDSF